MEIDMRKMLKLHQRWIAGEAGGVMADLRWADLQGVNLREANLQGANLLRGADLQGVNLRGADLRWADLQGVNLRGADLQGADLQEAVGNMIEVKSAQFERYKLTWTADVLHIGCQRHPIADWFNFTDLRIDAMDRGHSLVWWNKWKEVIRKLVGADHD